MRTRHKKMIRRVSACMVVFGMIFGGGLLIGKVMAKDKKEDPPPLVMETVKVEDVKATISLDEVMFRISELDELATVEYYYTDAGKFEDSMRFEGIYGIDFLDGKKIPFTGKSFVVRWDGCIKAGINIGEVKCGVDEEGKTIYVQMPEAKLLSHEIFEDSFETLDESKNIFNQIAVDDVNTFIGASKGYMEEKTVKNGLLDSADRNAKRLIENTLRGIALVGNEYKIVFADVPKELLDPVKPTEPPTEAATEQIEN